MKVGLIYCILIFQPCLFFFEMNPKNIAILFHQDKTKMTTYCFSASSMIFLPSLRALFHNMFKRRFLGKTNFSWS